MFSLCTLQVSEPQDLTYAEQAKQICSKKDVQALRPDR